jgi:hypothetical protein
VRKLFTAIVTLALCVAAAVPRAYANEDRVSFFQDIRVADGEEAHDAVCFLCSIHVDGELRGDAVAFLGSIHADGVIDGDTVTFLGNVTLGRDARIGKDCVTFLGSVNRHGDAQIGKDVVQFPLALIFIPLIVFIFLVYVIRSLVFRARIPYPMPPPPPPPMR